MSLFKKKAPAKTGIFSGTSRSSAKQGGKKKFNLQRKVVGWSVTTILVMVAVGLARRGLGGFLPVGGAHPLLDRIRNLRLPGKKS